LDLYLKPADCDPINKVFWERAPCFLVPQRQL
jgi:hypothetical protein